MPPPPPPPALKAAEPKYGRSFDPWNSVALGHQRAETRGPRGWRDERARKLHRQLLGGQEQDSAAAAAADDDQQQQQQQQQAKSSVVDMLRKPGSMSSTAADGAQQTTKKQDDSSSSSSSTGKTPPLLFDGLVVYVNGSTHPLVSDHKLKRVLVEHGARVAGHLGRRTVTHVILGRPSHGRSGAGGGLAGGKLEREVRRVGGCGVKYVGVEWVLESIKAGRRLPEARFANLKVASKGQPSVYGAFTKKDAAS